MYTKENWGFGDIAIDTITDSSAVWNAICAVIRNCIILNALEAGEYCIVEGAVVALGNGWAIELAGSRYGLVIRGAEFAVV